MDLRMLIEVFRYGLQFFKECPVNTCERAQTRPCAFEGQICQISALNHGRKDPGDERKRIIPRSGGGIVKSRGQPEYFDFCWSSLH